MTRNNQKTLSVTQNFLNIKALCIDNLFADIWNSLNITRSLKKARFKNYCRTAVTE